VESSEESDLSECVTRQPLRLRDFNKINVCVTCEERQPLYANGACQGCFRSSLMDRLDKLGEVLRKNPAKAHHVKLDAPATRAAILTVTSHQDLRTAMPEKLRATLTEICNTLGAAETAVKEHQLDVGEDAESYGDDSDAGSWIREDDEEDDEEEEEEEEEQPPRKRVRNLAERILAAQDRTPIAAPLQRVREAYKRGDTDAATAELDALEALTKLYGVRIAAAEQTFELWFATAAEAEARRAKDPTAVLIERELY
jgi:hypothetical protein